jgi:hypothetical protein
LPGCPPLCACSGFSCRDTEMDGVCVPSKPNRLLQAAAGNARLRSRPFVSLTTLPPRGGRTRTICSHGRRKEKNTIKRAGATRGESRLLESIGRAFARSQEKQACRLVSRPPHRSGSPRRARPARPSPWPSSFRSRSSASAEPLSIPCSGQSRANERLYSRGISARNADLRPAHPDNGDSPRSRDAIVVERLDARAYDRSPLASYVFGLTVDCSPRTGERLQRRTIPAQGSRL